MLHKAAVMSSGEHGELFAVNALIFVVTSFWRDGDGVPLSLLLQRMESTPYPAVAALVANALGAHVGKELPAAALVSAGAVSALLGVLRSLTRTAVSGTAAESYERLSASGSNLVSRRHTKTRGCELQAASALLELAKAMVAEEEGAGSGGGGGRGRGGFGAALTAQDLAHLTQQRVRSDREPLLVSYGWYTLWHAALNERARRTIATTPELYRPLLRNAFGMTEYRDQPVFGVAMSAPRPAPKSSHSVIATESCLRSF